MGALSVAGVALPQPGETEREVAHHADTLYGRLRKQAGATAASSTAVSRDRGIARRSSDGNGVGGCRSGVNEQSRSCELPLTKRYPVTVSGSEPQGEAAERLSPSPA